MVLSDVLHILHVAYLSKMLVVSDEEKFSFTELKSQQMSSRERKNVQVCFVSNCK